MLLGLQEKVSHEMKLYRWDSVERKFKSSIQHELPRNRRVVLKRLRVGKGQRIRPEVASGELLIRLVEGAWRMRIANSQLTVRRNEAVIIPSGFSHSAEAIEDSFALQMSDRLEHTGDESLWAV